MWERAVWTAVWCMVSVCQNLISRVGTLDSGSCSTQDVMCCVHVSMYDIYTQAEMSSCVWIVHVISANCWACAALAALAKN